MRQIEKDFNKLMVRICEPHMQTTEQGCDLITDEALIVEARYQLSRYLDPSMECDVLISAEEDPVARRGLQAEANAIRRFLKKYDAKK